MTLSPACSTSGGQKSLARLSLGRAVEFASFWQGWSAHQLSIAAYRSLSSAFGRERGHKEYLPEDNINFLQTRSLACLSVLAAIYTCMGFSCSQERCFSAPSPQASCRRQITREGMQP